MTVHFDGLFSTGTGRTGRLTYVWDFGDGTYGTGGRVTHTYHRPAFADVRLVVADGKGHRSGYRQALKRDNTRCRQSAECSWRGRGGSAVLPVLKGAAAEADRLTRGFVCGLSCGR